MLRTLTSALAKVNTLEIAWVLLWLATISYTNRTAEESLGGRLDYVHLLRLSFTGAALFIVLLNYARGIPKLQNNPVTIFFFYIVFSALSTLWSASWIATLGKAGEIVIAVLIVMKVAAGHNALYRLKRLLNWYVIIYGAIIAISVVGVLIYPEIFSRGRFRIIGPLLPNNGISTYSALIAIISLARYFICRENNNEKKYLISIYVILAIVCIYAQGRSAMTILLLGSAILFFIYNKRALLLLVPAAAVIYVVFQDEIFLYILRGQEYEDVFVNLSGRRHLWELGLKAFTDHPFIGAGFAVGSRVVFLEYGVEGYHETISSLHNGILEVVLGTGLIGLSLWVASIVFGLRFFLESLRDRRSLDISIVFVFVGMGTIGGTGVGGWMGAHIGMFLIASAYLAIERKSRYRESKTGVMTHHVPSYSAST